jgi:radical SAM superfamily enzyme YgiQ (UPF0313 family)
MQKNVKSILYIRLPCWKIYPGGVIYVADYIHKQKPGIYQEIIDMALIDKSERKRVLNQRLKELKPDIVAFSWRNMQTFGPHPENDALDIVMAYDFSPKIMPRLKAIKEATWIIRDYISKRINNFAYMKMVRKLLPDTRIVVGGTAVSLFGEYVVDKCPSDTVVVIGEGEDSMLSIVNGFSSPVGDYYYKDKDGRVIKGKRKEFFNLENLKAIDFKYIESIFPAFKEYLKDEFIGVQTKRGCPYRCLFCLYNKIEGYKLRYRDPDEVAKEVESLNKDFGVKYFWFADAQFCSVKNSIEHMEKVLDGFANRKTDISWTGYLRLDFLTKDIAKKMIATGICSIDTTFTGSQHVVTKLALGYSVEKQMEAFKMFKDGGHTDQKLKLYMPLNAPGEDKKTLRESVDKVFQLYEMFGKENVLPFIFFIGIQPDTPIERLLIKEGYLKENYDPLTLNPFTIKRLLYNPPPLGKLIGESYLDALKIQNGDNEYIGRTTIDLLSSKLK